jgi:hypothetical protein
VAFSFDFAVSPRFSLRFLSLYSVNTVSLCISWRMALLVAQRDSLLLCLRVVQVCATFAETSEPNRHGYLQWRQ